MLISRRRITKPGYNVYSNISPDNYTKNDMIVGDIICLEGFIFLITSADEYTLRYMESHSNQVGGLSFKYMQS